MTQPYLHTWRLATKPKSKKMVSTINSYTKALIDIWKRSFGDLHVTSRSSVTNKLQKLVNLRRKSEKHKKM